MRQITSEGEWLSSDEPLELARFARGRVDSNRFRWLAVDWAGRIRHVFEPDDLPWFDAFAAWVAGTGPHPYEVCQSPVWCPLDYPFPATAWARHCADAIRTGDPLRAAASAAFSASADYPFMHPPLFDPAHAHRARSKAKRAAEEARTGGNREARWAAKTAHAEQVRREFCDAFRDVAGNPFRPVTIRTEWRTAAVVDFARGVDTEQRFDWLPILADALEDAGCADTDLIGHCRGAGPHVRGCWAIAALVDGV